MVLRPFYLKVRKGLHVYNNWAISRGRLGYIPWEIVVDLLKTNYKMKSKTSFLGWTQTDVIILVNPSELSFFWLFVDIFNRFVGYLWQTFSSKVESDRLYLLPSLSGYVSNWISFRAPSADFNIKKIKNKLIKNGDFF